MIDCMPYYLTVFAVLVIIFVITIFFQNKRYKNSVQELERLEKELAAVLSEKKERKLFDDSMNNAMTSSGETRYYADRM